MLHVKLTRSRHGRLLALALASLAALLALSLIAPRGAAADESPPFTRDIVVSPATLPYTGGTVTVTATVTDEDGVVNVSATLENLDTGTQGMALLPTGVPDQYSSSIVILPNYRDEPAQYLVYVHATDGAGNTGAEPGGDVTLDAQPQFNEKPDAFDPAVAPRQLPSSGGPVALAVSGTDTEGYVSTAFARIAAPDGTSTDVALDPISFTRFEGTFTAPANASTTAKQYAVSFIVADDTGQEDTEDGGTFTVAAAAPPPKPSAGRLQVAGTRSFGNVVAGQWATRTVTIRHAGPRSSTPIAVTVAVTGTGFSLTSPASFTLVHGQRRAIAVEFRPPATGKYAGVLTATRADGAQPALTTRLSGKGKRK